MHPVIRISLFLIFTYFLIQGKPDHLLLVGFILFCLSILIKKIEKKIILKMISSLKWFYLSIFILFYFFTPIDNNIGYHVFEFSYLNYIDAGVFIALSKVLSLILIVLSVVVFISTIPKAELFSTIIWFVKPFEVLRFSSERFAVRIYLIIDLVEKIPEIFTVNKTLNENQGKIKQIISVMKNINSDVFYQAENCETLNICYEEMRFPWSFEWLYVFFCIGLFVIIDY